MPIPAFDWILNILPPHLGDPTDPDDLSPYLCTTEEVCDRFATTPTRKSILDGFLRLRDELRRVGVEGFQWVGGSFMEDIEVQEGRDPRDIDIVTFAAHPATQGEFEAIVARTVDFRDRDFIKAHFHVDHFLIPLYYPPSAMIYIARYWYGLFSHRRDSTWKGMLHVDISAAQNDASAWQLLRSRT